MPEAVVRHEYAAVIDKRFLTRHTLVACPRDGALRASIPSVCSHCGEHVEEVRRSRGLLERRGICGPQRYLD